VENYLIKKVVAAAPVVVSLLDRSSTWQPAGALATATLPGVPRAKALRLIRALVEAGLLERESSRRRSASLESWGPWLPHAGLLHFGTKDEPYPSPASAVRELERRTRGVTLPPATKSYSRRPVTALPPAHAPDIDLSDVLLARRTWRRFGRAPVSIHDLATLLGLTWGVQHWGRAEQGRKVALKTSPSGGAMHPGEVYVAAFNVLGLSRGLHHYDAARHRLTFLAKAGRNFRPARYVPRQPWYRGAAALMLMTAVPARARWKYLSPRAYRALLIDAGHLCQTFCLVATSLELAPFCSMALADSTVEGDLSLDGISEIALYAAGVGTRPA
jgi:SagB-type dehydrogenase family enzyme